jgi:ferredoxin
MTEEVYKLSPPPFRGGRNKLLPLLNLILSLMTLPLIVFWLHKGLLSPWVIIPLPLCALLPYLLKNKYPLPFRNLSFLSNALFAISLLPAFMGISQRNLYDFWAFNLPAFLAGIGVAFGSSVLFPKTIRHSFIIGALFGLFLPYLFFHIFPLGSGNYFLGSFLGPSRGYISPTLNLDFLRNFEIVAILMTSPLCLTLILFRECPKLPFAIILNAWAIVSYFYGSLPSGLAHFWIFSVLFIFPDLWTAPHRILLTIALFISGTLILVIDKFSGVEGKVFFLLTALSLSYFSTFLRKRKRTLYLTYLKINTPLKKKGLPTTPSVMALACRIDKGMVIKQALSENLSCVILSSLGKGSFACPDGCLLGGDCVPACPNGAITMPFRSVKSSKKNIISSLFKSETLDISKKEKEDKLPENQEDPPNGQLLALPLIDPNKCIGCGKCQDYCPQALLVLLPKNYKAFIPCKGKARMKDMDALCQKGCLGCGLCRKACPYGAIIRPTIGVRAEIDQDLCPLEENHCSFECQKNCQRNIISIVESINPLVKPR